MNRPYKLSIVACSCVLWTMLVVSPTLRGEAPDDPLASPTERSLHFTPGISRSIGDMFSQRVFTHRYQLPVDKQAEVSEIVSRRLGEWVKQYDSPEYQASTEQMFAGMLEGMAEASGPDRRPGFPPGVLEAFAKGARPTMASLQDTINLIGREVRPMLPFKQQLKMATDLTTFGAAFDALEERMTHWEQGDVDPQDNPFRPKVKQTDPSGEGPSHQLAQAQRRASQLLKYGLHTQWGRYVKEAIAYYKLDDAQIGAVEALHRDYKQRVDSLLQNETLQDRKQRLTVWRSFWSPNSQGQEDVLAFLIDQDLYEVDHAMLEMDAEFKRRIDEIPTDAQRVQAQQRAWSVLEEKGISQASLAVDPTLPQEEDSP